MFSCCVCVCFIDWLCWYDCVFGGCGWGCGWFLLLVGM